ncbi:sigma-70 family RNA polymerase sigma factor [Myroides ceti]|uniref:Sigma-70 family RNA polymerase sigma factor n=1 Tax=Paenimyroides ceti TaxID=395087 RepID=A0ABT8CXW6_9FLAO|nr:sigma-70 family RNA polymerase sigma factor [Paenimyroides ceti]MDN3706940.1 sigma-70 family RNA polymerase sigma factor [Paenimyroides ceti]MDN3709065.1 sigma-70 family RNA polymerase sigma factor [Paenimyroides ceti]
MAKNDLPDAVLIHQYVSGNEEALAQLIERHQSKVFRFIYSKVNDQEIADDIFQDTFIKVIHTLKGKNYKEEGKFLPWVMRISHNLVIDYFRKNNRMPMQRETEEYSIFNYMVDASPNIESDLITSQIESDVQKLINALPEDQREVITLRIYQDLSFKEIAEITGVSINTALGRMRYALLNLRKNIEKNQIVLEH